MCPSTGARFGMILGDHAAITKHHHLDCTIPVRIRKFVIEAGYGSHFFSRFIDIMDDRQDSEPIVIGDYCSMSMDVVMLGGAGLPARSVLSAKSLPNNAWTDEGYLYDRVLAKPVKAIPEEAEYFQRSEGFVSLP